MNRKDYILLDLDGTLTDPERGITKPIQHALVHFGIQIDDLDNLTPFTGPPLRDSFKEYYGFSNEQAWEEVQMYQEYFSIRGWVQNKEYPGIKEMLEALKEAGRALLVATSKPKKFAKKILEYFDTVDYFNSIGGANMGEAWVHKGDVIRYMLEQYGLEPDDETTGCYVMAGDREHDVLGARGCGMGYVNVLYGYDDRQEMDGCRPTWTAGAVKGLGDLLLSL